MNTPPTMSEAPFPMAPIKSSRKNLCKLDIKPKKLLYSDPDNEVEFNEEIIEEAAEMQESSKDLKMKSSVDEASNFSKHIEQNELDNEAEEMENKHSYHLRQRIKNQSAKHVIKKKAAQKKVVDKENMQIDIASTSALNQSTLVLSQPEENATQKEKIIWLQERRDVGLWIQCCVLRCQKWRFVEEFHDPVDVPKKWICAMNQDKNFASCSIPQDPKYNECDEDLIENKFNAGSIVWAKINCYPWWPAMIDDCPDTLRFYELKGSSQVPVKYHVTFFEEPVSRAWLVPNRIKPLQANDTKQPIKRQKVVFKGVDYSKDLEKNLEQAKAALPLSISQRLKKLSFISRYSGKIAPLTDRKSLNSRKIISSKKKTLSSKSPLVDLDLNLMSREKNSANLDSTLASLEPTLASLEPTLPSLKPTSASLEPTSASLEPTLPSLDPTLTSLDQLLIFNSSNSIFALKPSSSNSSKPSSIFLKPQVSSDPTWASSLQGFSSSSNPTNIDSLKAKCSKSSKSKISSSCPTCASSKPKISIISNEIIVPSSKSKSHNSKLKASSDPTWASSSKPVLNSTKRSLVSLKSTPAVKYNLFKALEADSPECYNSYVSTAEGSKYSDYFEPSLPSSTASSSSLKETSQRQEKVPEIINESSNDDSGLSKFFGSDSSGIEEERYFKKIVERYNNFDIDNLDDGKSEEEEEELKELLKEIGEDEARMCFDSEDEEMNWIYLQESANENEESENSFDSSDFVPCSPSKATGKRSASPNLELKRVDELKKFIDEVTKEVKEKQLSGPSALAEEYDIWEGMFC